MISFHWNKSSVIVAVQDAIQSATGLEPSVKAVVGTKSDGARVDGDNQAGDSSLQSDVLSAVTQLLSQSQEVIIIFFNSVGVLTQVYRPGDSKYYSNPVMKIPNTSIFFIVCFTN